MHDTSQLNPSGQLMAFPENEEITHVSLLGPVQPPLHTVGHSPPGAGCGMLQLGQLPFPSQLSSPKHSSSGSRHTAIGRQLPFSPPVSIARHDRQLPSQGLSQQTPSAQDPWHSALLEHTSPAIFLGMQTCGPDAWGQK